MRKPDIILSGLLLALTLAASAGAVDTLNVKVTEKRPWTLLAFGASFPDTSFVNMSRRACCVAQDGSIWWGRDGVVRYDGRTWTKYTSRDGLMDGMVRSIVQAADGSLWFAGSHRRKAAITRFDGRTWRIYSEGDGLSGNWMGESNAVDTHGNLWVTTEATDPELASIDRTKGGSGVMRFNGKVWRNFRVEDGLVHNRVYDIAAGPDGSVWFSTFQGVSRFDGKTWISYTRRDGLNGPKGYRILVGPGKKVWCVHGESGNRGVSVFDGRVWKGLNGVDGMPVERLVTVCQADDGALWFGTHQNHLNVFGADTRGLLRYQDGAWLRILREDGLPGDNVHHIAQSRDGGLYLTVPDVGLVRYRPDLSGLGTISGTVVRPDGSPWAGVGIRVEDKTGRARAGATTGADGGYRVRVFPGTYQVSVIHGRGTQPAEVEVEAGGQVQKIHFAPGRIEPGTAVAAGPGKAVKAGRGKVIPPEGGKGHWRNFDLTDGLAGLRVRTILQDREGYLWFGTDGGVNRYDGSSFATFTSKDGLANNYVSSILQDREGYLWFGTFGGGVSRYDGKSFATLTVKNGLANNYVSSILQDREGYLWFGTNGGGVSRYDGKSFTTFTTKDGLVSNGVLSVFQDREGVLWFGTWEGVSRYDPSAPRQTQGSGGAGRSFTTFTFKDGLPGNRVESIFQDREGYLWFGSGWSGGDKGGGVGGVSRYDGKSFAILTVKDGLANNFVSSIFQDREGYLWFGTDGGGVSRYDGKSFTTFTQQDGLAQNWVGSIFQDREGYLWFGTGYGGVSRYDEKTFIIFAAPDSLANREVWSLFKDRGGHLWCATSSGLGRYDGKTFTIFTTQDNLQANGMWSIFEDREGRLWFCTDGGVVRYDGKTWTTFTTKDGLAHGQVFSIFEDREGYLWFGTQYGVSRYDGKTFTIFTEKDGMASDEVFKIFEDREGNLWFCTQYGVSRYNPSTARQNAAAPLRTSPLAGSERSPSTSSERSFTTFTGNDGLMNNRVSSIFQDRDGHLWFSGGGGVSRYDRQAFTTLTTKDGLMNNDVNSIVQDRDGHLWFATYGGGVSRYAPSNLQKAQGSGLGNLPATSSGQGFTIFTQQEGLASNMVSSIFQDQEGSLWFGTDGGITRYDGKTFQTMLRQDGLAGNSVSSILQDREGNLWFGGSSGLTRFHLPAPAPPPVFVDALVAGRRYEGKETLQISSSVELTAFEFHGISFKTRHEAMVYRYRLKGYDKDWTNTRARHVEYKDLPIGTYTFEVVAVDRDLVYSEKPATVTLRVHPPYGILALAGGLGLALIGVGIASGYAVKRRRERDRVREALMAEMQKELQTAHEMQMALMPKESPHIEGLDIAGRCIPANHVGGDYFQYFSQDDRLTLSLADVTGHAMEAAIPVVMFSGLLKSHMELGGTLLDRFDRLNRSLYGTLTGRTLVCLAMGELDLSTHTLSLSDSGCPYPYHYRAATGEVVELQVDAYPLGVRPDTAYPVIQAQLGAGDRVVFCSDGVSEAVNAAGEQFGYERTMEAIRGACEEGLSAEATIDRILEMVNAFRGDAPQADDMTCVVLRVDREGRENRP